MHSPCVECESFEALVGVVCIREECDRLGAVVVVNCFRLVGLLWVGYVWGLGGEGCRWVRVCVGG